MTEKELVSAISDEMRISLAKSEYVVRLMRWAAEHAKVNVDLTTSGKVYKTEFIPEMPK